MRLTQISRIGKSDTHDENSSLVRGSDVFYRLSTSTRTFSDSEAS
jgi:hypothetical protein